ncbi:3-oxo-5-alpha-steroid 4-dehydrogenase-domain-containing protein [Collybia nuda]|uniref:3-oxo-5-alpha-steroid 4-dehydrogenase-domain-containing protein n=1 Tax=Collybia nuda TaxID=64659 RepID=A0A9P6CKF4_9AGAR|nr:3-oxo-5-alpha-steroid 4-dehydrogenase-domain-containing protein [Collybia nuda]
MFGDQGQAAVFYNIVRKWFTLTSVACSPLLFVINAPFGRFSLSSDSLFQVDGIKSWIIMELVSPISFLYAFFTSPLSYMFPTNPPLSSPQLILAGIFLVHYTNRALISPLRTPSRSKSHIIVFLSAVCFNVLNGAMMGAYLTSPFARIFLTSPYTFRRPTFYIGLALWAVGFAGNILHDEILLDIRRKAKNKDKGEVSQNGKATSPKPKQEHYGIPQGWLYKYISYPNYFCEWVEWLGFALAAAPLPLATSSLTLASLSSFFTVQSISSLISDPAYLFAPNLAPPYIFLISEVFLMFPRAYKGHQWYKKKFGKDYPKERKIVIPHVL